MKVIDIKSLPKSRKVEFHAGISNRILLDEDNMGYTMTKTVIEAGTREFQHYKHHLESCYCVSGHATLTNAITGEEHEIREDITYVLDKNDPHVFEAHEETVLICVFNPPLTGQEVHREDGSYAPKEVPSLKDLAKKHKPVKDYLKAFVERYEGLFGEIRDEPLNILEIGVGGFKDKTKGGGSLRMWSEYFKNSKIIGLDINEKEIDLPSNSIFIKGCQTDRELLESIVRDHGPFDIVIDDASHITEKTIETFNILNDHTARYYVVEDLHMKKAAGTREYFEQIDNSDFETKNLCVINKTKSNDAADEYGFSGKGFKSPVYNVLSVPIEKVKANDYNPNAVAPPEMELLETSIWEDGYTQPVVVVRDKENDQFIVVDGFHRYCTLKNSKRIMERENGMLPVVVLEKEMHDRMASTIRHNRARGAHNIELMSSIVAELVEMGKGDRWICQHIGMSPDELLRLKQITGLAALFENKDFSDSWNAEGEFEG